MPEEPSDDEIDEIQALLGQEVVDRVQQPVGPVGQVFVDERTGQPSWVTVSRGWTLGRCWCAGR